MNFKELFPLQVVINLDSRPDRLKICKDIEFPKLDINPIRMTGVVYKGTDNTFLAGSIGCMLSHVYSLQAAALLNSNIFIWEDDASIINDNAKTILDQCSDDLSGMDWQMFYAGANILKPHHKVTNHLSRLSHAQSTCAYGVNKNFIPELLKKINPQYFAYPIDVTYAETVVPNNNCFISYPMVVIQRDGFSNIENKDVKYSDYLMKRYEENFRDE